MPERRPYRTVVFLASFLTFCLELSSAKLLLPRFGGSAFVWTTCVMFFQALLLLAYACARAAVGAFGTCRWSRVHLCLLVLPLFFFPVRLPAALASAGPMTDLLWALTRAVAVPFLLLSTTTLVIQGWAVHDGAEGGLDAYHLFGASNLGALAALVLYPFALEPLLSLDGQSYLYLSLYSVYAVLQWPCRPRAVTPAPLAAVAVEESTTARRRVLWLLLSAAPCAAMLATSNLLTFDFAAVPLLWTVPLAVYLLTFVLNFGRQRLDQTRMNSALLPILGIWTAVCLAGAVLTVLHAGDSTPVQTLRRLADVGKFGYVIAALFVVGMVCHRSLAASRPSGERATADFYTWLGAGGLMGSLCIGVLTPRLGRGVSVLGLDWAVAGVLAAAAIAVRDGDLLAGFARRRPRLAGGLSVFVVAVIAAGFVVRRAAVKDAGVVFALRNFYGVYTVVDKGGVREFFHGNTDHGMQSLDPARAREPLTYYNTHSPLAEAFAEFGAGWRSIGVVGLGGGAIAAYGRAGQTMDFYELDPDVAAIADRFFTYLKDCPAKTRVITGDARLRLDEAKGASYDLLILDAFNSGAVPVHLLTREALRLYLDRMPPDGLLLLHVSNRYLDLRPMLAASAAESGLHGAAKRLTQNGRIADDRVPSSWVALSRDASKIDALVRGRGWAPLSDSARGARPWTDRHASLLPVLAL
jgi:hypothetical protein